MEDDDKMPNVLDRRRLKDRIIEGVSKAVKKIQSARCCAGNESLVLSTTDYQFHKLIENLDHAFLHGLRHITNGYWVIAQHFSHKMTVRQVQHMTNVTTNLGRGRAWLYLALCDHLLESYLRCFTENTKLVKKYYVSEALVLDQQRMQILLMLSAGLEHIIFELDADVPYLDLSSHDQVRPEPAVSSDDHVSLCSMESSMSQCSMASPASQTNLSECSDTTTNSNDTNRHCRRTASVTDLEKSRMDRIGKITPNGDIAIHSDMGDLEVIHVKRKGRGSSHRKSVQKRKTSSVEVIDQWPEPAGLTSPQTPESGYRSVVDRGSPCCKSLNDGESFMDRSVQQAAPSEVGVMSQSLKGADSVAASTSFQTLFSADINWTASETAQYSETVEGCHLDRHSEVDVGQLTTDARVLSGQSLLDSSQNSSKPAGIRACDNNNAVSLVNGIDASSNESGCSNHSNSDSSTRPVRELSIYDDCSANTAGNSGIDGDNVDGKDADSVADVMNDSAYSEPKDAQDMPLVNPLSCDQRGNNNKEMMSEGCSAEALDVHRKEHKVDNNLILLLTLDIFEDEDERFMKMFRSHLGHTEGELRPIFVLISSRALYILTSPTGEAHFHKEAVVTYKELDYISLSLNFQVINIVCTNRRKQLWVTTADGQLTKSIVGTIDNAIRQSDLDLLRLSVLTDATTQKIAIKKWVAQENSQQVTDVTILCYVLVHWEDAHNVTDGRRRFGITHEGTLLHKTPGTMFTGAIWRSSYFVLRGSVLHQYADSHKSSSLMTVQLNSEECTGCRRMTQAERKHCFEIILSDGSTVQLCAASEVDLQSWLQSLCEVVADSISHFCRSEYDISSRRLRALIKARRRRDEMSYSLRQKCSKPVGGECLPCCCVLTTSKILMCHEDVQTNFVRTLGSANVTDTTCILVDSTTPYYCVLVFEAQEAGVSTERWVVYWSAVAERDGFLHRLQQTWKMHYEVAGPAVRQIDDIPLQKRCRDSVSRLRAKRAL